ncbi:unnamed protein product [Lactuca virosa]|uniref:Uncharacterized protein n=1 Tax=Lactuca virosa TaxID=75947 RepID=A0AAU9PFW7_9ASTR|nr:unnamed protein product [Lactuca virosa]
MNSSRLKETNHHIKIVFWNKLFAARCLVQLNEPYVEEECQEFEYDEEKSDGDQEESDGDEELSNEDKEEFDGIKLNSVEDYESKILDMYHGIENFRKELVVKIDAGVLKFPKSQN